jgi:hypothetical protein
VEVIHFEHQPQRRWENRLLQKLLLGGLSEAIGNVQAKVPPNLNLLAPKAGQLASK